MSTGLGLLTLPQIAVPALKLQGGTLAGLRAMQAERPELTDALILAGCQAVLKDAVDAGAEEIRLSLITPGSGQAMEYQQAQAEATALLALPSGTTPNPADYPMLAASVGTSVDPGPGSNAGKPTKDVAGEARAVDAARKGWLAAGAAIRGARLDGKKAIGAAATPEAAASAFDAVAWPTLG